MDLREIRWEGVLWIRLAQDIFYFQQSNCISFMLES